MSWRARADLWGGVAGVRRVSDTSGAEAGRELVAFFVVAESREDAAGRLFARLWLKGWEVVSLLNLQGAGDIDDEAAKHLHQLALDAEAQGASFSDLPDEKAGLQ